MSTQLLTGTIKWYSRKRGFGFVTPDAGGEDIFVHHSSLPENYPSPIDTGDRIVFSITQSKKGPAATEIRRLDEATAAAVAVDDPTVHFADLDLIDPLLRAVQAAGYVEPTPIQVRAIPHVLAGRDLLGCAQTGTGKTAAFALPILQHLTHTPATNGQRKQPRAVRVLVLSPTRELAIQIDESFSTYARYTDLTNTVIYGGVKQGAQVQQLQRGVDILTATPGRLLDLIAQGYVKLNRVEVLVLDEADRMLDMGFIRDVQKIVKQVPEQRQTLLFSATLPTEIVDLAARILHDPLEVSVTPEQPTVEAIDQAVYMVPQKQKQALLEHLLRDRAISRALVFTRTKHGANRVVKNLRKAGIQADPIHGNKSQGARQTALQNFRDGNTRVLVATDVVSRGIDVEQISHVIQFELPNEPEVYIHRIGRTGRAGAAGSALAFCDEAERPLLKDIEKLIKMRVPVVPDHPYRG